MDTRFSTDLAPRRGTFRGRRRFLALAGSLSSVALLAACGGSTTPAAPTTAPAKPTEAPKPAEKPTESAKPAEKPAEKPAAAAAPTQAAPAAKPVTPNLQGTSLSVLQWSNFVPECDQLLDKQFQETFARETGAAVKIEHVNQNDIAAKIAAAIQTGSGPDIIMFAHNWAHTYKDGLVDLSDVVDDVKKTTGDFYPIFESYSKVDGKYLTMPHDFVGLTNHWRRSWFKEVGAEKYPGTFAELHEVGGKLKANGHPLGQCLGHSLNDPNVWCYPMLWAYGGREVDEQGKVDINSPETIAAVGEMKRAWSAAYDETGLAWDDSSNNRAFLAGQISATLNGASIWWEARKNKHPIFDDIGLDLMVAGPKGQFSQGVTWSYGIMKYSKNVEAAKALLRWSMRDEVWMPWFEVGASFHNGVGPKQNDNPLWDKFEPVVRVFKQAPISARGIGWPGPASQKAGTALAKFIVVDMFAKAVQGDSPEAAAAWAHNELTQIYG